MTTPKLYCFDEGLSLPSPDPECMAVQAYFKFCNIVYDLQGNYNTSPPTDLSTKFLPLLKINEEISHIGFHKIIEFCREQDFNLDSSIHEGQQSEILLYKTLIEDRLYPVLQYHWWILNYNSVWKVFFKKSPWFLRWILPYLYKKQIQQYCERMGIFNEEKSLSKADEVFHALSLLLAKDPYFYGQQPTSLDAYVFGILSCILLPSSDQIPHRKLVEQLEKYTNLCEFTRRIYQEFFQTQVLVQPKSLVTETKSTTNQKDSKQSSPIIDYKRRTKIIYFSIVGISLFILSILNRRIILDALKIVRDFMNFKGETEIFDTLGNSVGYIDEETGEKVLFHEESYYADQPSFSEESSPSQ